MEGSKALRIERMSGNNLLYTRKSVTSVSDARKELEAGNVTRERFLLPSRRCLRPVARKLSKWRYRRSRSRALALFARSLRALCALFARFGLCICPWPLLQVRFEDREIDLAWLAKPKDQARLRLARGSALTAQHNSGEGCRGGFGGDVRAPPLRAGGDRRSHFDALRMSNLRICIFSIFSHLAHVLAQVAIRTLALEKEALIAQGRKVVCPDKRLICDAFPLKYGRGSDFDVRIIF